MQIDRAASRRLNVVCGVVVLVVVSGLGTVLYVQSRSDLKRMTGPRLESPDMGTLRRATLAAKASESRGDALAAERHYRTALRIRPLKPELVLGLTRSLIAQDKPRAAWEACRSLVESEIASGRRTGGDADVLAWYADWTTRYGGDHRAAETAARLAFPNEPKGAWPTGRRLLSMAHLWSVRCNSDPAALRHIARAIEIDPGSVPARLGLARLLVASEPSKASETVKKARRLAEEGNGVDWMALAAFYQDQRQTAEAKAAVDLAFQQVRRSDTAALLDLIDQLERLDWGSEIDKSRVEPRLDAQRASGALHAAWRAVHAEDALSLLRIARRFATSGEPQKAFEAACAARRVTPPRQTTRYASLAYLYRDAGQKEEAKAMLREAIPYAGALERASMEMTLGLWEKDLSPSWGGYGAVGSPSSYCYRPYGRL